MLKFLIATAIALTAIPAFAGVDDARADVLRLGRGTLYRDQHGGTQTVIVDPRPDACVGKIAISATGDHARIWDVTVGYRAPQVTRDVFHVNKVVRKGESTPWITLIKAQTGLCVRRVYVEGEAVGFSDSDLTVYGVK